MGKTKKGETGFSTKLKLAVNMTIIALSGRNILALLIFCDRALQVLTDIEQTVEVPCSRFKLIKEKYLCA